VGNGYNYKNRTIDQGKATKKEFWVWRGDLLDGTQDEEPTEQFIPGSFLPCQ
jgi:hypothetical protein